MKVYISGPMTGLPENNYPAFHAAEDELAALGFEVVNPARNEHPDPPTWENFMRLAIPQVCECDMVCLLPGWSDSKGAQMEANIGSRLGMACVPLKRILSENL
jgi:hypothetical protein